VSEEAKKAIKYDSGKTRFSLLPWDALREVAAVREYGVRTYGSEHCWQDVEPRRYVDALLRHGAEIVADGIHSRDAESGLLHSAHIACNALFLVWFAVRGQGSATVEGSEDEGKYGRLYGTYLETLEAREALAEQLATFKDPKPNRDTVLSPEKFGVVGFGVGKWMIRNLETGRTLKYRGECIAYGWCLDHAEGTPFTTRASAEAFMQGGAK